MCQNLGFLTDYALRVVMSYAHDAEIKYALDCVWCASMGNNFSCSIIAN